MAAGPNPTQAIQVMQKKLTQGFGCMWKEQTLQNIHRISGYWHLSHRFATSAWEWKVYRLYNSIHSTLKNWSTCACQLLLQYYGMILTSQPSHPSWCLKYFIPSLWLPAAITFHFSVKLVKLPSWDISISMLSLFSVGNSIYQALFSWILSILFLVSLKMEGGTNTNRKETCTWADNNSAKKGQSGGCITHYDVRKLHCLVWYYKGLA